MGSTVTREGAAAAFDRFWPRGLPFPPEAPWLAARVSRRRAGNAYTRVVTDPLLAARVAQEAGIDLHQEHEDENAGTVLRVIYYATLAYLLWRALKLLEEEEGEEPEDTDTGDTGETEGGEGDEGGEGGDDGGGGYWDPDGTLGGRKPTWA